MIRVIAICLLVLLLGVRPTAADEAEAVRAAETAAKSWLAVVDAGSYDKSWENAAALFRGAVTREDWAKAARAARAPLGAVKSRTLKSTTFTHQLPGAPDGDYVVIQFDASFANKAAAVETVTPMRDPDGTWRVSGYFVK